MTHLIRLVFVTLLIGSLGSKTSLGELRIDITQGTIKPMPIAVTDLVGNTAEERKIGKDITRIISADLERSGLFNPISKKALETYFDPDMHEELSQSFSLMEYIKLEQQR